MGSSASRILAGFSGEALRCQCLLFRRVGAIVLCRGGLLGNADAALKRVVRLARRLRVQPQRVGELPFGVGRGQSRPHPLLDPRGGGAEVAVSFGDRLLELALRRFSRADALDVGPLGRGGLRGGGGGALHLRGLLARRFRGFALLARKLLRHPQSAL